MQFWLKYIFLYLTNGNHSKLCIAERGNVPIHQLVNSYIWHKSIIPFILREKIWVYVLIASKAGSG